MGEHRPAAVMDAIYIDGEQTPPSILVDLTDETDVGYPSGTNQNVKLTKIF